MRIPRKITPDGLTDAVVIVGYETTDLLQSEIAAQVARIVLAQGFYLLPTEALEPIAGLPAPATYYQEQTGLVISSRPGQLGFNGVPAFDASSTQVGHYVGWVAYRQLLSMVLEPLLATRLVQSWTAVSVRYINILPWWPVAEQLRVTPAFPVPEGLAATPTFDYRLHWPATATGEEIRLRLTDQTKRPGETASRGTLFDVSVTLHQSGENLVTLQAALELAHQKQKEVFFGLLSPAFLASLQPEYDSAV